MPSDAPTAFFSYSREDEEFALRLAGDLKAASANVWIDKLDIVGGQWWDKCIENALTSCSRILVILSPASVNSKNVMDEVSFALEEAKTVIPVLYRDCAVPFRLRRIQHLDFRTDYANGLRELLKTLGVEQPSVVTSAAAAAAPKEAMPAPTDTAVRKLIAEQVELELERRQAEQTRLEQEHKQATEQARVEKERQAEKSRLEQEERDRLAALAAAETARREQEERKRQAAAEEARLKQEERARQAAAEQARAEHERQQAAEEARLEQERKQALAEMRLEREPGSAPAPVGSPISSPARKRILFASCGVVVVAFSLYLATRSKPQEGSAQQPGVNTETPNPSPPKSINSPQTLTGNDKAANSLKDSSVNSSNPIQSRFVVGGPASAQTVVDSKTGLMWTMKDYWNLEGKYARTWYDAMDWARKMNAAAYGGYSDWAVPTIAQYRTINASKADRDLDAQTFERTEGVEFWASNTPNQNVASYITFAGTYAGFATSGARDSSAYSNGQPMPFSVRLVRSQPASGR